MPSLGPTSAAEIETRLADLGLCGQADTFTLPGIQPSVRSSGGSGEGAPGLLSSRKYGSPGGDAGLV